MSDKCESCGIPWENHPGIQLTCASLQTQRLINAELRKIEAPRQTLEMLVRLGFEMECLSASRCAELLNENIVAFRERGWIQSRIRDVLDEATEVCAGRPMCGVINQILKDYE